jgi:thioredoxin 1
MKEAVFAFLIALVIGAFINQCGGFGLLANPSPMEHPAGQTPAATDTSLVPEANEATWDQDVVQSNVPVFADFYSDSCAPCKEMAPVINQLAQDFKGKAKFVKVNVEQSPAVTARYNVQMIPTFIIIKNGQVADSYQGLVPRSALAGAVTKTLGSGS